MPTHERQLLRRAVIDALLGPDSGEVVPVYATSAGARVDGSREAPQPDETLPNNSVYTDSEEVDPKSKDTAPRRLQRNPLVTIVAWVSVAPSANLDDALDAIALEIETAIDTDSFLDGTAQDTFLTGTEFGRTREGARPMGAVSLTYSIPYESQFRAPDPTDELEEVRTDWNLGGAQDDEDDQAHDITDGLEE
jgi:hypothetical protein